MFRFIAILASLVSAAAFAPARMARSSSALKMSYESELGVLPPVGFFDPLGLSKDIDADTFENYRLSEIKHGRAAMLGVLGYIVPEVYKFPGEIAPGLKFADIPNGVAAIQAVPALGWVQIFFLIGWFDFRGNGFGPKGLGPHGDFTNGDEELLAKYTNNEIQNGRLAMLACLELLRHDSQNFVTGTKDVLITGLPFLYGN